MTRSSFQQYIYSYITYQSSQPSLQTVRKRSLNGKANPTGSDCKWNQPGLLNLSQGYKQNNTVVLNTTNNKENMNKHIRRLRSPTLCSYMCIHYIHKYAMLLYEHICQINTRQENIFMTQSFLFTKNNKSSRGATASVGGGAHARENQRAYETNAGTLK